MTRWIKKTVINGIVLLSAGQVLSADVEPKIILSGNAAEPTIVRTGDTYYLTTGTQSYSPSFLIWHSTDLRNWTPQCYAARDILSGAPELAFYKNLFYLYQNNVVMWSENPATDWKAPILIAEKSRHVGTHPGHIVDADGARYLYFDNGQICTLSNSGFRLKSNERQVYTGWRPSEEDKTRKVKISSPKLFRHGEWYYMLSDQTKPVQPSTIILARSKAVDGPWEEAPASPLLLSNNQYHKWTGLGHASAFEDSGGQWFLLFHGYRQDFPALGGHTLILPLCWTEDGWLEIADIWPKDWDKPIVNTLPQSDEFNQDGELGLQWQCNQKWDADTFKIADGKLTLPAAGDAIENGRILAITATDEAYEIETALSIEGETQAGLALFCSPLGYINMFIDSAGGLERRLRVKKEGKQSKIPLNATTIRLKITNNRHVVSFYFDAGGGQWNQFGEPIDISMLNTRPLPGNETLRPAVYAAGKGSAKIDYFRYRKIK